GAIEIFAFTHVFTAGPELAPVPSVARVSTTPPTESVTCAETVVCPVPAEVSVTLQLPVVLTVRHDGAESAPGPESFVKSISVPTGAFWNPLVPLLTFTCAVNVCV